MNWWYSTRLKVFIRKVGCAVVHWLLLWVMYCKSDNFCLFGFSKMVTHILICFCLLLWVKWLSSVVSAKCLFCVLCPIHISITCLLQPRFTEWKSEIGNGKTESSIGLKWSLTCIFIGLNLKPTNFALSSFYEGKKFKPCLTKQL